MTMISRDPFARQELHRETVNGRHGPHAQNCDWCGSARDRMFRYRTETDGGRKFDHRGVFCSKSCHDAYHS